MSMPRPFRLLAQGALAGAIAATVSLVGCGLPQAGTPAIGINANAGLADVLAAQNGSAPWSLVTLVAHDNDLSGSAWRYLDAFRSLARIPNLYSALVLDTPGTGGVDVVGFNGQPIGRKDKEINSGSAEAVSQLLAWSGKNFPAESRTLVLADHGGGVVRGIMVDDSSGRAGIRIPDLAETLTSQPVQTLMFDACLMQMVEVAYELRGGTQTVIAAESVTYAGAWPYPAIGKAMSQGGSAEALTRRVVDAIGPEVYRSSISGVRTAGAERAVAILDRLAKAALPKMKADPRLKEDLVAAIGRGQSYKFNDDPRFRLYHGYRDLISTARHLAKVADPEIAGAARDLEVAAKDMVIRSWRDESHYPDTHGVSFYAPIDGNVDLGYAKNSALAKDTLWDEFLVALNSRGDFGNPLQPDPYPRAFPTLEYPGRR